jgi:hypothetical protein
VHHFQLVLNFVDADHINPSTEINAWTIFTFNLTLILNQKKRYRCGFFKKNNPVTLSLDGLVAFGFVSGLTGAK